MNDKRSTAKILWVCAAMSLMIFCGWCLLTWGNAQTELAQRAEIRQRSGLGMEKLGVFDASVQAHLDQLSDKLREGGTLLDSEIDNCVALFDAGPKINTELNWTALGLRTSFLLGDAKHIAPAQHPKIENFAKKLIARGENQPEGDCIKAGLLLLRRTNNPNGHAYYEKYLNSKIEGVRKVAQNMLKKSKKQ